MRGVSSEAGCGLLQKSAIGVLRLALMGRGLAGDENMKLKLRGDVKLRFELSYYLCTSRYWIVYSICMMYGSLLQRETARRG